MGANRPCSRSSAGGLRYGCEIVVKRSSRSGWFLAAFQERQALSSSNVKESNEHASPETVVTVENEGDGTHATGLLRLWRCVDCGGEKEAGGGTRERKDRDGCSPSDALRTRGLWLTRIFRKIVVTKHSFVQEIPSCAASAGIAFYTKRERPEVSERECTAVIHVRRCDVLRREAEAWVFVTDMHGCVDLQLYSTRHGDCLCPTPQRLRTVALFGVPPCTQ